MNLDDTNRTFGVELELLSPVSDRDLVDALNTFCQPLTWYGADDCPKNNPFFATLLHQCFASSAVI